MVSDQNQITGNTGTTEVQLFQASCQGQVGPFVVSLGGLGGHGNNDQFSESWVESRMAESVLEVKLAFCLYY